MKTPSQHEQQKVRGLLVIRLLAFSLFMAHLFPAPTTAQGPSIQVFADGLQAPTKVLVLTNGLVVVAESGSGKNDGRISLFNPRGERRTLIDGLPSGIEPVGPSGNVSGPNSIAVAGRTLYISIGIGDSLAGRSMQPGTASEFNPFPSSPLFSSIMQLDFQRELDFDLGPFSLNRLHHIALAGGASIRLDGKDDEHVTIQTLINFLPDHIADPSLPGYRGPNPFDIVIDARNPATMYMTDGGLGRIVKVDLVNQLAQEFIRFAKIPRPPGTLIGPFMIDPFPTGARQHGDHLYVALLTGFPFAQRASQIQRINLDTGVTETVLRDLTSCVDVEPLGANTLLVLQLSTNLFALPPNLPRPGRLLRFDLRAPTAPTILADGLMLPNSMARHASGNNFFIVEIGAGRVLQLSLPS